jgi:PAS domain S-box-containing protein
MGKMGRIIRYISILLLLPVLFPACGKDSKLSGSKPLEVTSFASFRDVPGVTEDEIKAVEELQKRGFPFIYGTPLSTEAFVNEEGELDGFAILLCDWLAGLFGIQFKAEIYDLNDILAKMKSGEVHFGALTTSEDRLKTYYMTAPIMHRSAKVMRIKGRPDPAEIALSRPVRYAFMEGSTLMDSVTAVLEPGSYEAVVAGDHETIYEMLMRREADAYIGNNVVESALDPYGGVVTEDFLPLIVTPISLAAQDSRLAPVISIVSKALASGAYKHMTDLYGHGYEDYRKNKFLTQLSEEERAYVRDTKVVPIAAQFMSYPFSFYNTNNGKWEGIVFDVLDEMENLTGLKFELVNDKTMDLPELMNLLENGTAYIIPNLIQTDERMERFIWPNTMYLSDKFALLSKRSYPNVELNDIPFIRVGFAKDSAFADLFRSWFPDALYAIEYPGTDDAFMAVERGEIDMVMSSQSRLTALTNYYEFSDYKANYLFSVAYDASFGLNKNQTVLCSIIDKALPLINTDRITEQWISRTYNIESMRLKEQRPWLLGSLALIMCVLVLLAVLFERSRLAGKKLENLVKERTHELSLQTAKLQSVFDSLPDIVFCKDLELRYTQCNRISEERNGVIEADLIGKTDLETKVFPKDVAEWIMEADRFALKEGRKVVIEETLPYHNGVTRVLETVRSPLVQDGEIAGLIVIARDITRRKEVERELELQTATLTTLFDSIPDLIFTKDLNLYFLQCNKSFLEYFNKRKEDVVGKIDNDAFGLTDEVAEKFLRWDRRVISENKTFAIEEPLPRYDGVEPLYETIKTPLVLDGKVIGLLAIARDITRRKEIERELALQTATLTTLFDSIPDLIFTLNTSLRFTQCNKSFLDHFGLNREYIINKGEDSLGISAELTEEHNSWNRRVINEGKKFIFEERIPAVNGENLLYETVKTPLVLDGKIIGVLGIAHDITMRKEMEDMALSASRSKSIFLANMSHEIRTPMNSIIGFSELALDGEASLKTRDYLSKIQSNAEWLLQIINDILDISKIESGKMELENIPFDMHELFENCRTLIIPKAVEKGIKLQFYAEPSVGKRPLGDPTRLRQILVNLLSNAVKFTNSGTVKVLTEIKKQSEKTVTFHFEVKDSGIGMTEEQIKRIFEPFMQAETGTTRKYGGTGLGLAISKTFIELMGGKLEVDSAPGIGSKFSFDLTFDTVEINGYEKFERKAVLDEIEKPIFSGEVLLCEDNEMNQQVICEHLARIGLKTTVAENGKVGVQEIQNRKRKGEKQFDLIFMDIHMPVMDGIEAAVKILELDTKIPIVAMTANIMSSDMELYKQSGMYDCIGKPFTSQELWRCLLKYLKPVGRESRDKNAYKNDTQIEEDSEFQKELKTVFFRTNQNKYREIEKALEDGDVILANRLAHSLKTNAGHINKHDLQQAAAEVEQMLKGGKNLVTAGQMIKLNTELQKTLEELKSFQEPQAEEREVSALEPEKIKELFERLVPLLKAGNPESLSCIDELHAVAGSGRLIQHIEDFNFEAALVTLAELRKKAGI